MSKKIDWDSIPKPLQEALMTAARRVSYDLATDASDFDRVDVIQCVFSVITPTPAVSREWHKNNKMALQNAARDCGESVTAFKPCARFDPWGPRGCIVGDE